ncbi:MAG: HAMP domain-containing protein [Lachnospiraceae bacterium]|nr:HAMP domain-containing protein [Lachnospiraceae bacterium]
MKHLLKRFEIFRSLKARLFVILLLAGLIPAIGMRIGILSNYEDRAVELRTSDVQNQFKILANHLVTLGYMHSQDSDVVNAELEQFTNLYDGRVLIIDRNFKVIKDTYGISEGKFIISEEVINCFNGVSTSNYDDVNGYIEITTPIIETAPKEAPTGSSIAGAGAAIDTTAMVGDATVGVMLTSVSTDNIVSMLSGLSRRAHVFEIIVMVLFAVFAFIMAHLVTAPFERITASINAVKAGFTDEKIEVDDYLETEHIVDAFNQMRGRMKLLDDSRQEFVSNVSHELKTPLTSMKVLADSLIAQEEVPNELYREFMTDIADEIERENTIINDLLSLVKMDLKEAQPSIAQVDVNALIELIMKRLRPIAVRSNVELIFESLRPVTAQIDEVKITLAFTNLVENAIKYNNPHGWVRVTLDADHQYFTLEVADNGIGIPEDSLDHIYERFYRVDKSHSREIGGTGLGLSITRNAILMHRGTIDVTSHEGEGTRFTVRIPLIYT